MKYLILFAGLTSLSAFGAADPKKVVLFIDSNNSVSEVADAKAAAEKRGETFLRLPEGKEGIAPSKIAEKIKELAAQNIAITSTVISGHDGGGKIHGALGHVDKYDVINALKEGYKGKPELLAQMKSVFMWGCWSMGPSEVAVWRQELPSIKMASGFIDMGPLNTTEASGSVLKGLLINEKKMTSEHDQKNLKRMIASVSNIGDTYAAVYTEAACGDMYYYNTEGYNGHGRDYRENYSEEAASRNQEDKNYTAGTHFLNYNKNFNCKKAYDQIESNRKSIMGYFNGNTPVPTEGHEDEHLVAIYSFVRSHSNCLAANHVLNGDRIGMMRFFDSVKENFANVFKAEISEADKQFKHLDNFTQKYQAKGKPMKDFTKYLQNGKSSYFTPDAATLKTKSRKEIINLVAYLDGLTKQSIVRQPDFAKNLVAIRKMKNAVDTYLYQLNPQCMDFLSWHEVKPGRTPSATCNI